MGKQASGPREIGFHKDCDTPLGKYVMRSVLCKIDMRRADGWFTQMKQYPYGIQFQSLTWKVITPDRK